MPQTFPTEFPALELKQVVKFVTKQDEDLGKLVLAGWTILGYIGFQSFGSPVLQLAGQLGVKPEDTTPLQDMSPKEVVMAAQRLNDLINKSQSLKTMNLDLKQQIPQWVIDLLFQILETFLNRNK